MNLFYKLLMTAFSFSIFSEGIILPIYAVFVQKIGGDILDASGAMAAFLITQGICTILVHRMKWTKKQRIWLLGIGWLIWTLGIALYLTISSVFMLFLSQMVTALGNAIADPILDEELSLHTDRKLKEFEWGFYEGIQSFMQGIAAIIGGLIATYYGFSILIYTMIISAGISCSIIMGYIVKVQKPQIKHTSSI